MYKHSHTNIFGFEYETQNTYPKPKKLILFKFFHFSLKLNEFFTNFFFFKCILFKFFNFIKKSFNFIDKLKNLKRIHSKMKKIWVLGMDFGYETQSQTQNPNPTFFRVWMYPYTYNQTKKVFPILFAFTEYLGPKIKVF